MAGGFTILADLSLLPPKLTAFTVLWRYDLNEIEG